MSDQTFLVCLPVISREIAGPCLDSMFRVGDEPSSLGFDPSEVLAIDNCRDRWPVLGTYGVRTYRDPDGHNLGVAGAWNIAAREVLDQQLDWLVIASTVMRYGPELHTTFRREVEANAGAQIVECHGNSWHLIAIARSTLEIVGLFDTNYYPAYEEAIDWGYRQKILGLEALGWPRVWCNAMSAGHAMHVDRSKWDAPSCPGRPLTDYYEAKWGGPKVAERFVHPFGDPTKPLDWFDETPIPVLAQRYGLEVWW